MDRALRFGQMAVALGYLDEAHFGEAMYRLGRGAGGVDLRGLLIAAGWLDVDQARAVDEALRGEPPGELLAGERYELLDELGRGSFGRIIRAWDRRIGRPVAIKTLQPALQRRGDAVSRFLFEAQVAGQLTHPNVIPVYEIGTLPDGTLFYAMEEVEGHTLHEVLSELRDGGDDVAGRYPLPRLVGYLRQVCQAVAYAHAQGVIHRDLKPHNVMIGPYGEVFVLDWGSAKLLITGEEEADASLDVDLPLLQASAVSTVAGKIKGTPAYMAPEQARADADLVGPLTDVYALGALLYNVLCLHPPFSGSDIEQVLEQVVQTPPPPPRSRAPDRSIPAELEELAMLCLAKEPALRPRSAQELIRQLSAYLEGTRRREEAQAYIRDAEAALDHHEELRAAAERLSVTVAEAMHGVAPWSPVEDKRSAWAEQRKLESLHRKREEAFNLALVSYQQALGFDPDHPEARRGLAELYWQKYEEAERKGDEQGIEFFRAQVLHTDDGRFREEFSGMASIAVESDPAGAEATLFRYDEHDRMLVPGQPRALGTTPTAPEEITQGSYLLTLRLDGHVDLRFSLFSNRPGARRYRLRMRRHDEVGPGYVPVPAGRFLQGGDPRVPRSWPRSPVYVPDFAIARHPVTFREYMQFLDDLAAREGRDAVLRHAPRTDPRGRRLVRWDADRGAADLNVPDGERDEALDRPVYSISFDDACAYARWRSALEGRAVRLPTEAEWEKAARGVDGRLFPWGDAFEPTYCNCRTGWKHDVGLRPVGSFGQDRSPYDVADLAGGVMEWCSDPARADEELQVVRGGAWNRAEVDCSLAAGRTLPRWTTGTGIGVRLVAPLLGTVAGGLADP